MHIVGKIADYMLPAAAAAWLLAVWLGWPDPVRWAAMATFWVANLVRAVLHPRTGADQSSRWEPPPRWSGVSVVAATGFAAAFVLAKASDDGSSYIPAAMVAVGTLVVAILVWRFATAHAQDIGEARFAGNLEVGDVRDDEHAAIAAAAERGMRRSFLKRVARPD